MSEVYSSSNPVSPSEASAPASVPSVFAKGFCCGLFLATDLFVLAPLPKEFRGSVQLWFSIVDQLTCPPRKKSRGQHLIVTGLLGSRKPPCAIPFVDGKLLATAPCRLRPSQRLATLCGLF